MNIDDLFAELDEIYKREAMQPGDITVAMIANRYDVSTSTAQARMNEMAERPEWELLKVWEDGHQLNVLRKVNG